MLQLFLNKHEKGTAFSGKVRTLPSTICFGKVSTEGRQHTKFSGQGDIIKLDMGKKKVHSFNIGKLPHTLKLWNSTTEKSALLRLCQHLDTHVIYL